MKKVFIASGLALLLLDGMLVNCNAQCVGDAKYPDLSKSPYILPYQVGKTFAVGQGNCRTGTNYSHNGSQQYAYDFDMPMEEPVVAAQAGTVTFIEQDVKDNTCTDQDACKPCIDSEDACQPCTDPDVCCKDCTGNHVVIKNDDGSYALYEHLRYNGVKVKKDQRVSKGQVIAKSGNSGESTSPHLHFEVFSCTENSVPCLPNNNDAGTIPIRFSNSKPKDKEPSGLKQISDNDSCNSSTSSDSVDGCYKAEPFHNPSAINSLLLSPNN